MYRLSHYTAILLLLLFARVMVPDALILELHTHTHSVHAGHTDTHDTQIAKKHTHCPVEDLFDAPFQGTATAVEIQQPEYDSVYSESYTATSYSSRPAHCSLRGPPIV